MSLTLKVATATTIALSKARALANGVVMQLVGASFLDVTTMTATQNVGQTGTAKSRFTVKRPYTTTVNGVNVSDNMHIVIEVTVPETCPLTTSGEATWLAQSLAASTEFNALVQSRSNTFA